MKNYRCTHNVEAAQWQNTNEDREHFANWFQSHDCEFVTLGAIAVLPEGGLVYPGEWIIFSDNDFIAMDNEQFQDTYMEI